jgi:excisionase family DNA binding protein
MPDIKRGCYSPAAAAAYLDISKRSLSKLIASGQIAARKFGRRTLIDVESLDAWRLKLPLKLDHTPIPNAPHAQP